MLESKTISLKPLEYFANKIIGGNALKVLQKLPTKALTAW